MPRLLAYGECGTLVERFREAGFEVLRAPGSSRALGLARDLLPELIVVGGGADEGAAIDLVRDLAADPVVRLLPVLLLLPRDDLEALGRGFAAGASDVVTARMAPEEWLARANAALRVKQVIESLVAEKQRLTLLELAGAVAHKINQPLTSMSILVETLLASSARGDLSGERLGRKLEELQVQVERMAAIVRQVASLVEYRTVDYVGDVRIIDLEPGGKR